MPFAEVSITKNLVTKEEKSIIAQKLTKILLDSEGLIDNPISRSIALLDIREFDCLYVGGQNGNCDKVVIKIHMFSDVVSKEIKKRLFKDITDVFISVSNKVKAQNGRNVWCIINSLHDFDFGAGGVPITLEDTRNLVSSYGK
ncbi:hypothetical protein WG909_14330 [Peptostreptococcaceae bacterium AGR-M142]